MQNNIVIEGRAFKPMKNGTFAHDIWLMQRARASGLADIQISATETEDQFVERLAAKAWESGAMLELLAGTLIPEELEASDWTPELAKTVAQFFANVTDEQSKATLRSQIGGLLFLFFMDALSSLQTSRKSGEVTNPAGERQGNEGLSTTEIGATS
jgi:hypothetical protein